MVEIGSLASQMEQSLFSLPPDSKVVYSTPIGPEGQKVEKANHIHFAGVNFIHFSFDQDGKNGMQVFLNDRRETGHVSQPVTELFGGSKFLGHAPAVFESTKDVRGGLIFQRENGNLVCLSCESYSPFPPRRSSLSRSTEIFP